MLYFPLVPAIYLCGVFSLLFWVSRQSTETISDPSGPQSTGTSEILEPTFNLRTFKNDIFRVLVFMILGLQLYSLGRLSYSFRVGGVDEHIVFEDATRSSQVLRPVIEGSFPMHLPSNYLAKVSVAILEAESSCSMRETFLQ
jgi:hypothetical protein